MIKERSTLYQVRRGSDASAVSGWCRDCALQPLTSQDAIDTYSSIRRDHSNTCSASYTRYMNSPTSELTLNHYRVLDRGNDIYDLEVTPIQLSYTPIPYGAASISDSTNIFTSTLAGMLARIQTMSAPPIMNLPQAVLEFKDAPETLRTLGLLAGFVKRSRLSVALTIAEAAGLYLAYTFGVKPTVGDVRRFLGDKAKGRLTLQKKLVEYHKGQKVQLRKTLRPTESDLIAMWGSLSGNSGTTEIGVGSGGSREYSGVQMVEAQLRPMHHIVATCYDICVYGTIASDATIVSDLADNIRVNCPMLATSWELTPMSFVIDWFVDIGTMLRNYERMQLMVSRRLSFVEGVWQSIRTSNIVFLPKCSITHSAAAHIVGTAPYRQALVTWDVGARVIGATPISESASYSRQPSGSGELWGGAPFDGTLSGYRLGASAAMVAQLGSQLR